MEKNRSIRRGQDIGILQELMMNEREDSLTQVGWWCFALDEHDW